MLEELEAFFKDKDLPEGALVELAVAAPQKKSSHPLGFFLNLFVGSKEPFPT